MENKGETTIGIIGYILGLYWDNGKLLRTGGHTIPYEFVADQRHRGLAEQAQLKVLVLDCTGVPGVETPGPRIHLSQGTGGVVGQRNLVEFLKPRPTSASCSRGCFVSGPNHCVDGPDPREVLDLAYEYNVQVCQYT